MSKFENVGGAMKFQCDEFTIMISPGGPERIDFHKPGELEMHRAAFAILEMMRGKREKGEVVTDKNQREG